MSDEAATHALTQVFRSIDQDGDGFVGASELRKVFAAFDVPAREVQAALEVADTDKDERLSLEEFLRHVKGESSASHLSLVVERLRRNEDLVAQMWKMRSASNFIFDCDGVVYRGSEVVEGVAECLEWLKAEGKNVRFLTNNSKATPASLQAKFERLGLPTQQFQFWTAALSTAAFLQRQRPHGTTAFVVGGPGIHEALADTGVVDQVSHDSPTPPQYVIVGEADSYDTEDLIWATKYVHQGSILIGTNEDVADPVESGSIEPSCGAWVSVVEAATGKKAYYLGKPNPINLRGLLARESWHSDDCVMVGDRMSTDVRGAMEANIRSVLVLSGMTKESEIEEFPFRPDLVLNSVAQIPPSFSASSRT